jgi:hypothetical protein
LYWYVAVVRKDRERRGRELNVYGDFFFLKKKKKKKKRTFFGLYGNFESGLDIFFVKSL